MKPLSRGLRAGLSVLLEISARKPGNVHRFLDFPDLHFIDLAASAHAIQEPMNRAHERGVGQTILDAVEATRRVVATNTNLGTVILLAPLCAVRDAEDFAVGLPRVLEGLSLADSQCAFRAIRLADPASLGESPTEDVWSEPSVTLLEAMTLAADRDLVARQYVNHYREVREIVYPELRLGLRSGEPLESAIVRAGLTLLAAHPDSLIARKRGSEMAAHISNLANKALAGGSIAALDDLLRGDRSLNPGTTADLVAAGLYFALSDGTIRLPREPGPRDPAFSF
jgi:triphosphoribosyl-dephospho-CoA synthase